MLLHLLFALAISAEPASLAGKWGGDGEVFFELREGGKGKMEDESIKWEVKGDKLKITDSEGDSEEIPFRLKGDRLTITVDDTELTLERLSNVPAKTPESRADKLSRLLIVAPWCSKTMKVSFTPDGAWSMNALQSKDATTGRWAVKKDQLHMSNPPGAPELLPVVMLVSQNADNHPILTFNGNEYAVCKPGQ